MTDHLGTGWAFPVGPDARGRIGLVSGVKAVEQATLMVLLTPRGRRVMRPEYGCQIHELIFAPKDARSLGLAPWAVILAEESGGLQVSLSPGSSERAGALARHPVYRRRD